MMFGGVIFKGEGSLKTSGPFFEPLIEERLGKILATSRKISTELSLETAAKVDVPTHEN